VGFYLHPTFILLFLWVALLYWQQRQGLGAALECLVFILAIFASVVLHDLGHVVTAQKLGITLRNVTLLPIGGVARMQSVPEDRMKGFWIAMAGPGVSLGIVIVLYGLISVTTGHAPLQTLQVAQGPFWQRLLWANLFLTGFNLLPALPMDGGTALRSILATRLGYLRAIQTTAGLGQGATLLLGAAGLWAVSPFLLLVALSVWIGSTREAGAFQMRSALRGVPVEHVMISGVQALTSDSTLEDAAKVLGSEGQQDFPVVDTDGRIVGVLTHQDLLLNLAAGKSKMPVAGVMNPTTQSTSPLEMLDVAITRMLECDCSVLPVAQGERLVGLLTQERVGEFVSKRAVSESTHR
jgi:Zn-dependent protease/predicted transcriptional regulator